MSRALLIGSLGLAFAAAAPAAPKSDPEAAVESFHAALQAGDAKAAADLLADDALIFEQGGAERSKAEYAASHLAADIAFAKAVPAHVTRRSGHVSGDLGWVVTEGRLKGAYKGKPVARVTTETMILRRAGGQWKIVHIHWSSAAAP